MKRNRRLDLLVQTYLHEVDVNQVAAHRMQLHVLQDHGARVAIDLQVDERARADENPAQLALVGGEVDAAAVRRAVDDTRNLAALAQAPRYARAELVADLYVDCRSVGGHRNGPV